MDRQHKQLYGQIGAVTPDNLIAGLEITPIIKGVVLGNGLGVLPRGAVLGRKSDGTCALVDSKASDGSEKPYAILASDVTTDVDKQTAAEVYTTGVFNALALTFGGDDTIETHEDTLRTLGIHVKENVPY